jgi:nitrite reductase/ring-hydroxylating ferredoxin subunit
MDRPQRSPDGCPQEAAGAAVNGVPPARLPVYPVSWYLFGRSDEVRRRPVTKQLLGRELVAFRTAAGRLAVLEARCAHFNADLGRGCVVGETIRCPFHHWRYGTDGRCVHIPSQKDVPAFARRLSYPAVERHGYIYFFNGRQPLFDLPFFAGSRPEDLRAGRSFRLLADAPWYLFAANSVDEHHFTTQHNRRPTTPFAIDFPHPFARRVSFEADVVGTTVFERLLRRFAGDHVRITVTCWGGNFFFATGSFRRVESYVHVVSEPLEPEGKTLVNVIVFVRRFGSRLLGSLLEPLALWVRRVFTAAFLISEFEELAGIRYNPHSLIAGDRLVAEFLQWGAALPSGGAAAVARPTDIPRTEETQGTMSVPSANTP